MRAALRRQTTSARKKAFLSAAGVLQSPADCRDEHLPNERPSELLPVRRIPAPPLAERAKGPKVDSRDQVSPAPLQAAQPLAVGSGQALNRTGSLVSLVKAAARAWLGHSGVSLEEVEQLVHRLVAAQEVLASTVDSVDSKLQQTSLNKCLRVLQIIHQYSETRLRLSRPRLYLPLRFGSTPHEAKLKRWIEVYNLTGPAAANIEEPAIPADPAFLLPAFDVWGGPRCLRHGAIPFGYATSFPSAFGALNVSLGSSVSLLSPRLAAAVTKGAPMVAGGTADVQTSVIRPQETPFQSAETVLKPCAEQIPNSNIPEAAASTAKSALSHHSTDKSELLSYVKDAQISRNDQISAAPVSRDADNLDCASCGSEPKTAEVSPVVEDGFTAESTATPLLEAGDAKISSGSIVEAKHPSVTDEGAQVVCEEPPLNSSTLKTVDCEATQAPISTTQVPTPIVQASMEEATPIAKAPTDPEEPLTISLEESTSFVEEPTPTILDPLLAQTSAASGIPIPPPMPSTNLFTTNPRITRPRKSRSSFAAPSSFRSHASLTDEGGYRNFSGELSGSLVTDTPSAEADMQPTPEEAPQYEHAGDGNEPGDPRIKDITRLFERILGPKSSNTRIRSRIAEEKLMPFSSASANTPMPRIRSTNGDVTAAKVPVQPEMHFNEEVVPRQVRSEDAYSIEEPANNVPNSAEASILDDESEHDFSNLKSFPSCELNHALVDIEYCHVDELAYRVLGRDSDDLRQVIETFYEGMRCARPDYFSASALRALRNKLMFEKDYGVNTWSNDVDLPAIRHLQNLLVEDSQLRLCATEQLQRQSLAKGEPRITLDLTKLKEDSLFFVKSVKRLLLKDFEINRQGLGRHKMVCKQLHQVAAAANQCIPLVVSVMNNIAVWANVVYLEVDPLADQAFLECLKHIDHIHRALWARIEKLVVSDLFCHTEVTRPSWQTTVNNWRIRHIRSLVNLGVAFPQVETLIRDIQSGVAFNRYPSSATVIPNRPSLLDSAQNAALDKEVSEVLRPLHGKAKTLLRLSPAKEITNEDSAFEIIRARLEKLEERDLLKEQAMNSLSSRTVKELIDTAIIDETVLEMQATAFKRTKQVLTNLKHLEHQQRCPELLKQLSEILEHELHINKQMYRHWHVAFLTRTINLMKTRLPIDLTQLKTADFRRMVQLSQLLHKCAAQLPCEMVPSLLSEHQTLSIPAAAVEMQALVWTLADFYRRRSIRKESCFAFNADESFNLVIETVDEEDRGSEPVSHHLAKMDNLLILRKWRAHLSTRLVFDYLKPLLTLEKYCRRADQNEDGAIDPLAEEFQSIIHVIAKKYSSSSKPVVVSEDDAFTSALTDLLFLESLNKADEGAEGVKSIVAARLPSEQEKVDQLISSVEAVVLRYARSIGGATRETASVYGSEASSAPESPSDEQPPAKATDSSARISYLLRPILSNTLVVDMIDSMKKQFNFKKTLQKVQVGMSLISTLNGLLSRSGGMSGCRDLEQLASVIDSAYSKLLSEEIPIQSKCIYNLARDELLLKYVPEEFRNAIQLMDQEATSRYRLTLTN